MACILAWIEAHQGLASWAQAVFSVVAIAGAYWIGERQAAATFINARKLDDQAEERKRSAILAICEAGRRRAEQIAEILNEEYAHDALHMRYDKSIIDSVVGALSAVPVHELRSAEGAIAMLDLRDRLNFLKLCLERFKEGPTEFEKRNEMTDSGRLGVLRSNVRMFVGKINEHYEVVETAIRNQREEDQG
jgi:hypothetical protein